VAVAVDPNLTFESFVVGPENRLAWDAARTAAESPGSAYNPLFIYSDTGLGKTHLLAAIANRACVLNVKLRVIYAPLEQMLHDLVAGTSSDDYRNAEILLIDDLQFIGPRTDAHQVLFHLLDHLLMAGKQVVLACDRPPLELGQLDDRLLSRFSGGLVVDIARPALETRRAIVELRLAAAGVSLRPEVIDAIARAASENVRQLKGALNRVLAAQKAEEREITADEVDRLLTEIVGDSNLPWLSEGQEPRGSEFETFLSDVSLAVEEALGAPKWREDLARAILKWEAEGFLTKRLEACLEGEQAVDAAQVVAAFERDVAALRSLEAEFHRLQIELPTDGSLRDPDRIDDLRQRLTRARRSNVAVDEFFFDEEKVVWEWPQVEERLIESFENGHQG
jgi:hypothetical protein